MASSWRLLCTIVLALEGAIGLLLSLFLLIVVLKKKSGTTVPAYRFCIAVNASQGAFNCILLIAGLWTQILSDGYFLAIVYGPIKYAPKWIIVCCLGALLYVRTSRHNEVTETIVQCLVALFIGWRNSSNMRVKDITVSLAVFMTFSLWQFITAPCIVQYLVLFRKSMPNAVKIGVAYLFTAISMGISIPYFWLFVPYPAIMNRLQAIAKRVQQLTDDDDFVVYGIALNDDPDNGNRCARSLAFFGIAPSYTLTYAVFGFTVLQIVRELGLVNTELSIKTFELQRGFIRIHLIQGFIPLAILSIPFVTFISAIITGANIGNWTLMLTFSQSSIPAVQALVYLIFLLKAVRASDRDRNNRVLSSIPHSSEQRQQ